MSKAASEFTRAIDTLENNFYKDLESRNKETIIVYVQVLTNRALAQLNLKNYDEAIIDCDKTLRYEDKNLKALYRRALGKIGKGDKYLINGEINNKNISNMKLQKEIYEAAQKDLEEVTNLDKKNDVAKQKMAELVKNLVKLKLVLKEKEEIDEKKNPKPVKSSLIKEVATSEESSIEAKKVAEEPENLKKKIAGNLSKSELNEVTNNVMNTVIEELIKSPDLPKNITEFEKHSYTFKKYLDKYFYYLRVYYHLPKEIYY